MAAVGRFADAGDTFIGIDVDMRPFAPTVGLYKLYTNVADLHA
jgi:hypothetical protein